MKEPVFAIGGCGRSGTGYISAVLRSYGIDCGHEEWWGIDGDVRVRELDGDSSWLSTFDSSYVGVRFAQTRDPRQAIPSIAATALDYPKYLTVVLQTVTLTGDTAIDAVRIWYYYTKKGVDNAVYWWQLEQVDSDVVMNIAHLSGLEHKLTQRTRETGVVNSRPKKEYVWPKAKELDEAFDFARSIGYDV